MGYKHSKKYRRQKEIDIIVFVVFVALAVFVAMTAIFSGGEKSLAVSVSFMLLLEGIFVYFAWFRFTKPLLLARVMSTGAVSLSIGSKVLSFALPVSGRLVCVIDTLAFICIVAVCVYVIFWDKREQSKEANQVFRYVFAFSLLLLFRYPFQIKQDGTFWAVALISSAIVCIIGAVIYLVKWQKPEKWVANFVVATLSAFIVLTVVLMCIISNFNFGLDSSKPQTIVSVVEHKSVQISTGRRQGENRYNLYVDIDGKSERFLVPKSVYKMYEVGDRISMDKCEGFFGVEYYVPYVLT